MLPTNIKQIRIRSFKYEVNKLGEIFSLDRIIEYKRHGAVIKANIKGKLLKPYLDKKGYQVVDINGRSNRVHRLVAQTFIPNPENKPQVNHKDGNKQNNNVDNLEWCTNRENAIHSFSNGLNKNKFGEKARNARLTDKQIKEIFAEYKTSKMTRLKLAKKYNISLAWLWSIGSGRSRNKK